MFKEKKWSNRIQLILILIVFSAPLLGAWYMYQTRDQRTFTTGNNGELYSRPQELADITFLTQDGVKKTFDEFERKWYLVVVARNTCNEVCEQNLLKIRQLKRMQGKNIGRVVSLFVHDGLDASVANDLAAKYSVTAVSADSNQLSQWLQPFYKARGAESFDSSRIYMIDPLKMLMMSYPADIVPKMFHEDLKRLLKVSQIG